MVFIVVMGGLLLFTLIAEGISWRLFYRKMEPLHFPAKHTSGSHFYYLRRLRGFAVFHAIVLLLFIWFFLGSLW